MPWMRGHLFPLLRVSASDLPSTLLHLVLELDRLHWPLLAGLGSREVGIDVIVHVRKNIAFVLVRLGQPHSIDIEHWVRVVTPFDGFLQGLSLRR